MNGFYLGPPAHGLFMAFLGFLVLFYSVSEGVVGVDVDYLEVPQCVHLFDALLTHTWIKLVLTSTSASLLTLLHPLR